MALVEYSDSEPDEEDAVCRQSPPLPALPAAFHDLYASNARISVRDVSSLHGGRKRAIPHVEGNWPTHIYLEWYPSKREFAALSQLVSAAQKGYSDDGGDDDAAACTSLLQSDLGAQLPLHISLSRPVVLRTEQRAPFLDTLEAALKESDVPPFNVSVSRLDWVSNSQGTRWFLVLRTGGDPGRTSLNRLLHLSNTSLGRFGQPPLYESAASSPAARQTPSPAGPEEPPAGAEHSAATDCSDCFHLSLGWRLTEPSGEEMRRVASVPLGMLASLSIRFTCVKAKIGNTVTSIGLHSTLVPT